MTFTQGLLDGSVIVDLMKRLESEGSLDSLIDKVGPAVDRLIGTPVARAALTGRWLGHAIHPLLTDLPLGLWTATNVLDPTALPGSRASAQRLLALGLLAVPPDINPT